MHDPRARRTRHFLITQLPVIFSMLLLAPILAATTTVGDGPHTTGTSEATATRFEWHAPSSFSGDLMLLIDFRFEHPATCDHHLMAHGTFGAAEPIVFFARMDRPGATEGLTEGVTGMERDDSSVHLLDVVDTRSWRPREGPWSAQLDLTDRDIPLHDAFGGPGAWLRLTIYAKGLGTNDDAAPLSIVLDCDQPSQVTLHAGTNGVSFNQYTMEGGTGAALRESETTLTAGTTESLFPEEVVVFRANSRSFGIAGQAGILALEHPRGAKTWTLPHTNHPDALRPHFEGSAGRYAVSFTRAGTGTPEHLGTDLFAGILMGVRPVDSLDAAAVAPRTL